MSDDELFTAEPYQPGAEAPAEAKKSNGADEPLRKLIPMDLKGKVLPREWTVDFGWIPKRKVTLLQGDGGIGKSPLIQQLQSSCAAKCLWLGLPVEECASLGIYTEDEDQDLLERQGWIDAAYGVKCTDTGKMHMFPRVDLDNEMIVFDHRGKPTLTPFYQQVTEAARDFHVGLVTLDVAVDLFGGNEIQRREVRAFIRSLGRLARVIDGAVVLTSHVSVSGLQSDGGHSGSTDWSNAVRSRLYLSRPKVENGEPSDPNARILTRKKATFASTGDAIKLHWKDGVIVPDVVMAPDRFRSVDETFLSLLDAVTAEGQKVSPKSRASNYAPAFFMKRPKGDRGDYERDDFERAMQALFKAGQIKIEPYGYASDGFEKIVRADHEEEPL